MRLECVRSKEINIYIYSSNYRVLNLYGGCAIGRGPRLFIHCNHHSGGQTPHLEFGITAGL